MAGSMPVPPSLTARAQCLHGARTRRARDKARDKSPARWLAWQGVSGSAVWPIVKATAPGGTRMNTEDSPRSASSVSDQLASETTEFATTVQSFLRAMAARAREETPSLSPLGALLRDELGVDPTTLDTGTESFQPHQLADLDRALHRLAERHEGRWYGVRSTNRSHVDSVTDLLSRGHFSASPARWA